MKPALSLVIAFLGLPFVCWAEEATPAEASSADFIRGEVIVRVRDGTKPEQIQEMADSITAEEIEPIGDTGMYLFRFNEDIPVVEVVDHLKRHPLVRYAEPNYQMQTNRIGQEDGPAAVLGGGGSSVVVAVIDTGVDLRHPAFADRLFVNSGEIPQDGIDNDGNGYVDDVNGYDFYGRDPDPSGGAGVGAHGTQVAGRVLAGALDAEVKILPLQVGPGPWLSLSAILEAIDYAVKSGADIINMSFGSPFPSLALEEMISRAAEKGVLLVAAAGNSGSINPSYPAVYDGVVSVAASNAAGQKTSWSSYGPSVDFTAPGSQVTTATWGGGTATVSGTSFSAPFLAGVAARVLAAKPNLTPDQLLERIRSFAKDVYALNPLYPGWLGQGLVDDEVAQRLAEALPFSENPPPAKRDDLERQRLEAERVQAQQEVARLEVELKTAEANLSSAHDRVVESEERLTQADSQVNRSWAELLESWRNWYRYGFFHPGSSQEKNRLRSLMQEALDRFLKDSAQRCEAEQRLRVAQVEEKRAQERREEVARRLADARNRLADLTRHLAQLTVAAAEPATAHQLATQALLKKLQVVHQSLEIHPLSIGRQVPEDPELGLREE